MTKRGSKGLADGLKEPEEIALTWRRDKLGDGIQLDAECTSVSRRCRNGWGVQLGDAWLTKDITTVAIECHEMTDDTYIGVVGRNYNPQDWNGNLSESKHAVVLHAATGRVYHKGSETSFVLRPLTSGARLIMTIDMQTRELTLELKASGAADDAKAESTLMLEDIQADRQTLTLTLILTLTTDPIPDPYHCLYCQAEVAVCVCLGPGDQNLRIAGCVRSKPEFKLLGKRVKDFWDEENIVPPLQVRAELAALPYGHPPSHPFTTRLTAERRCHAPLPCCIPLLTQANEGKCDNDPQSLARKMQEELKKVTGFLE